MTDLRHHCSNKRHVAVFDEQDDIVLLVRLNLNFPDCFDWVKLKQAGYRALVVNRKEQ